MAHTKITIAIKNTRHGHSFTNQTVIRCHRGYKKKKKKQ